MTLRVLLAAALLFAATACADPKLPAERASGAVLWPGLTSAAHDHVNRRLDQIEALAPQRGGVLFVGDSITEDAPFETMFPGLRSANLGIAWDTSDGVLRRLGQITRHQPDRIVLLIGTNDTNYTDDPARIAGNILTIAELLSAARPEAELYVLSVLPRGGPGNQTLTGVNQILVEAASEVPTFTYLDLASDMRAPDGEMLPSLSDDNLHLNTAGYAVWAARLDTCVRRGCPDGLSD